MKTQAASPLILAVSFGLLFTATGMPPPAPPAVLVAPAAPELRYVDAGYAVAEFAAADQVPTLFPASGPLHYWKESADSPDHVTLSVSPGYEVLKSGPQIEGTGAFHLAHPAGISTETITLNPSFLIGPAHKLFFESRLGWATPHQVAEVQLSDNHGASWQTIWSQAGSDDSGEADFRRQEVSLAAWQGQTVLLRFRYRFSGGRYYYGTSSHVGWLIDDIQIGESYVIVPEIYSIGEPSGLEQQMLEFVNRARASASAEAIRLRDTDDVDVQNAMNWGDIDRVLLVEQFGELTETVPPLAFNARLIAASRLHSLDMFENQFQGHVSSVSPPPPNQPFDTLSLRYTRQGYSFRTAAENVYAYARSVWHGHAGFNIDWGSGSQGSIGGMQNPPGHRLAIHNANYREIGIGIVEGTHGPVGPMIVTQNFGTSQTMDRPLITGVAWDDTNHDGEYDPGEGLAGIDVFVEGERFQGVTSSSGGFAVPVQKDGVYTVRFSSQHYPDLARIVVVSGQQNVKVDYLLSAAGSPARLEAFQRHPTSHGSFYLFLSNAYEVPMLQISTNLRDWHDLPSAVPEHQGGGVYRVECPPHVSDSVYYRMRLP